MSCSASGTPILAVTDEGTVCDVGGKRVEVKGMEFGEQQPGSVPGVSNDSYSTSMKILLQL
ncbi:hypothetical protein J6590_019930 [Homalodisca vitripennis]|nr:hypothetical protein J6590_019930 [Homalodisca vitripennis]